MRNVTFEDSRGRKYVNSVPDDAEEHQYGFGIRVGPPDLSALHLPAEVETRLNNELFNLGILNAEQAKRHMGDLRGAIAYALSLDVHTLYNCYLTEGEGENHGSGS